MHSSTSARASFMAALQDCCAGLLAPMSFAPQILAMPQSVFESSCAENAGNSLGSSRLQYSINADTSILHAPSFPSAHVVRITLREVSSLAASFLMLRTSATKRGSQSSRGSGHVGSMPTPSASESLARLCNAATMCLTLRNSERCATTFKTSSAVRAISMSSAMASCVIEPARLRLRRECLMRCGTRSLAQIDSGVSSPIEEGVSTSSTLLRRGDTLTFLSAHLSFSLNDNGTTAREWASG
mmetsp:Transcript_97792/g.276623  ORF Transcript_97792/g.276623 Transcript_97792/m.276623 type:complete len:242 (+) Transcript_97792:1141-1866(+)